MRVFSLIATIFVAAALAVDDEFLPSLRGMQSISISYQTPEQFSFLKNFVGTPGFDFVKTTSDLVDVLVTGDKVESFKQLLNEKNMDYTVMIEDVEEIVTEEYITQEVERRLKSRIQDYASGRLSSDTIRHTLTHFGIKKKRVPSSLHKKPSNIPAVEAPHPGTSYNPSFEDHQKLLHEVAQKEMELIKEEEHLNRVTTKMFKKVSPKEKENNLIKEMSEGLKLEDNQDFNEDEDNNPIVKSINPPVKNQKKTRVQRRKQKEQKNLVHKKQQEKVEKKKISDIYKLRLLDKQLAAKENKEKVLQKKRLKKKILKTMGTKTLSKVKFEPLFWARCYGR